MSARKRPRYPASERTGPLRHEGAPLPVDTLEELSKEQYFVFHGHESGGRLLLELAQDERKQRTMMESVTRNISGVDDEITTALNASNVDRGLTQRA
jgi:hypothetical protein